MSDPLQFPDAPLAQAAADLLAFQEHGIASRVIARSAAGNVTLFAIDAGESISEHSAPFDALVIVLDGTMTITIGGTPVTAAAHDIVRLPANIPHGLRADTAARMVLVMLREAPKSM
ncbi:MAG: cupin domain-containing protein [Acidobacteria bacterium]|nr:cupin domain-containing protein [Acidobacteriota bacterium]